MLPTCLEQKANYKQKNEINTVEEWIHLLIDINI